MEDASRCTTFFFCFCFICIRPFLIMTDLVYTYPFPSTCGHADVETSLHAVTVWRPTFPPGPPQAKRQIPGKNCTVPTNQPSRHPSVITVCSWQKINANTGRCRQRASRHVGALSRVSSLLQSKTSDQARTHRPTCPLLLPGCVPR